MENLTLLPMEQLPELDEAKKKLKVSINQLQDNFNKLMTRDRVEPAEVQKSTGIPFPTMHGWYKKEGAQLLDLNIKELADYFDVSIDFLAFGIKKYVFDTFDRQELFRLKDEYEGKIKSEKIFW